ncbi:MAG: mandelate racemase/muconate lactonizing enzyme family protein [Bryobacterales bacterium]|nr:mandelate racemase/muconate lactonizing enzyme family protein [Bryobacterales bacterium]
MRVTDLQTRIVNLDFRNCVIVSIETDSGIRGVSETVMKRWTHTIEQAIQELRRYLIGKDPTEIEEHWEKMYRDSFWSGGPMHASAISAVDLALWDILAKSCGVPVHKLHGGPTRRTVPVYCHCPGGATPEEFARNVRACADRGYRALKTTLPLFYGGQGKPQGAAYSGADGAISRELKETEYLNPSVFRRIREFIVAAREAGGPDLGIAIDCHGRLNLKNAIRLCEALDDLDLMFIEEPVPPENAEVLARVTAATSIPIAAGERWATVHGVREFVEKGAVDILQCDIVNCGGFTGLKKIAALAETYYLPMAPHNPNGPIATMINLQFAASIPNYYLLETVGSEQDWRLFDEIAEGMPRLEDGALAVPCAPGYGFELNGAALDAHPYVPRQGLR